MYISHPIIKNKEKSLHNHKKRFIISFFAEKKNGLKNIILKKHFKNIITCKEFVNKLYEKGYNGLNILDYIENSKSTNKNKYLCIYVKYEGNLEMKNYL